MPPPSRSASAPGSKQTGKPSAQSNRQPVAQSCQEETRTHAHTMSTPPDPTYFSSAGIEPSAARPFILYFRDKIIENIQAKKESNKAVSKEKLTFVQRLEVLEPHSQELLRRYLDIGPHADSLRRFDKAPPCECLTTGDKPSAYRQLA